ncbi:MAG TPA: type II toxin-antitoxin system RelE/ParE family toxin [Verrucomicrobiae bacterium]|nr:type II toxin-antitoxin system RelE/ParE family toxin [Verrucomicrobiae bacterium]
MDYKIVWSDRSLSNLKEIVQFIAEDNALAAERMGNTIIKRASFLAQFPQLGAVFSGLRRDDVREIAAPPYRIIYQVLESKKMISILTVWHGARQEPEIQ